YIVTAKHVIDGIKSASVDDKVYLRVNKIDGTSVVLASTDIDAWKFHPSDPEHVDVAVLNAWIPQDTYDVRSILADMALTSEIIKNEQIGVGDEVFIPGLFVNHVGRQQNLPIVRTGAIARMPSEPIRTRYLGDIEAYLIEARSIGGISGSPVFVYMGHIRNRGGNMQIGGEQIMYYWLGLMHGHYDIEENKSDVIIEDGNNGTSVNMGIAIVVPVSKILEIINQDEFMKVRKQKEEELKNKNTPTPDMAMEEITKEQFEETLKKVSQKINPSELDSSKSKT
ncbi:hypothetical protein HYV22_03310, partial [Candidatus Gottesmanbacteria bacterium]|nr:hypothetical protein [Candidatus Gottesmanbacteria bacterium]